MYRIVKKTTKNSQYHCLKCKYVELIDESRGGEGQYVRCTAENKVIRTPFNARDFYCKEFKGFNDMTPAEIESIKNNIAKKKEYKAFCEYARKYYPKKQAERMIREKKNEVS